MNFINKLQRSDRFVAHGFSRGITNMNFRASRIAATDLLNERHWIVE
jgi:hypothetical protein